MCQEDQREYEFTSAHECENCDEINWHKINTNTNR
jgi:hypothetical protein